jgi:hypothetical protein
MESKPSVKRKTRNAQREREREVGQKGIIEGIWSELQVGYK